MTDVQQRASLHGIAERTEYGLVVLSRPELRPRRRVLFVNNYGGRVLWQKVKAGEVPGHHLWGCLELLHQGYEVALAESLPDFNRRRPLPHDARLLRIATSWLRKDDIVYCGHNVLFWLPFLRSFGVLRCKIVSLLFAKEPLDSAKAHHGVIALTPVAERQARALAPSAKVVHLGWGVDRGSYSAQDYRPEYLLHCGIAGRDFPTLLDATRQSNTPVRLIAPGPVSGSLPWPKHVDVFDGGHGYNHEDKKVSFRELVDVHYANALGCLIVTLNNPAKDHALGFTNMIEALAMGKPIIHTQTGALADEIDVTKAGIGLGVPPQHPAALARAMHELAADPARAAAMGAAARELCDRHYNIDRYAAQLHQLFENL